MKVRLWLALLSCAVIGCAGAPAVVQLDAAAPLAPSGAEPARAEPPPLASDSDPAATVTRPGLRMGPIRASGPLPVEMIHRVARQMFGRFRICYDHALKKAPRLAGRVTIAFAIERDGSPSKI